jgi:hypothetical protein
MTLTRQQIRPLPRATMLAVTLVALLLPAILAAPVSADGQEDTNQAIAREFDVLRGDIDSTQGLAEGPKTSLLAKVDAAEALLLPAVQAARESARDDVSPITILTALQQQNWVLSDTLGYDGGAIDQQAATIKRYVLTNAWPTT